MSFYLYSIGPNGNLYCNREESQAVNDVGAAWGGLKHIVCAGNGIFYAVDANAKLRWYRHDKQYEGIWGWSDAVVGHGWGDTQHLAAAGNGVLFMIRNNTLYRYHHTGWQDGTESWENWNPLAVGGGWGGIRKIFAQFGEHLYAIDENGNLLFYHINANGVHVNARLAGSGWGGFTDVFASAGVIFGVQGSTIHKYNVNADGSAVSAGTLTNPSPTHTRWTGGWSPFWWETGTVAFFALHAHPKSPPETDWIYYLLAHDSGAFTGDAEQPAPGSRFTLELVERLGPRKASVRIRTRLNRYLMANAGGNVMANSTNPGAWETWIIEGEGVEVPGKTLGFMSWESKLLKQDFILNELAKVPFRSTPGVPLADFAGNRVSLSVTRATVDWTVHRQ